MTAQPAREGLNGAICTALHAPTRSAQFAMWRTSSCLVCERHEVDFARCVSTTCNQAPAPPDRYVCLTRMAYCADASRTTREVAHSPAHWSSCYSRGPTSVPTSDGMRARQWYARDQRGKSVQRGASRIPRRRGPDPGGVSRPLGAEPAGHLRSRARSAPASLPRRPCAA